MTFEKIIIGHMEKCYSLALLEYNRKKHIIVGPEKINKCLMYNLDGVLEETIWENIGGVMSIVPLPGTNGQFLATQEFYSPNDSKKAKIIHVSPSCGAKWHIRDIVRLPFVHRFDILSSNGAHYLIACTLKSDHTGKDDWSSPGKVYAIKLPENLNALPEYTIWDLDIIQGGLLKNHGYYKLSRNGKESAVVSCEQGVFHFMPPDGTSGHWEVKKLISDPASDALFLDIDNDGEDELITLSPFHGDTITFYKKTNGKFEKVSIYKEKLEFLHALYGGVISGKPVFITGYRKGRMDLLAFVFNSLDDYEVITIDQNCGSANVLRFNDNGKDFLVSANRETDEIAMYRLNY
jgi:hypothetical protein